MDHRAQERSGGRPPFRTEQALEFCFAPASPFNRAFNRGLLLRCGNDFAAFAPPLIVTADEIDEMTGILGECIAVAERELGAAR